jgi:diadenosine tetraphosphate (Ap4A) HIT family hydrolase
MSVFLQVSEQDKIFSSDYFFVIKDRFPVSPGHCLIISKESKEDFFALSHAEREDLVQVIEKVKTVIEKEYKPDGYNIGMNCGEAAGQTVISFSLSCNTQIQRGHARSKRRS